MQQSIYKEHVMIGTRIQQTTGQIHLNMAEVERMIKRVPGLELAGIADYSAIDQGAVAVGTAHALLNSAGLGLYLLSMWARAHDRRGLGLLLSTTALGIVSASAGLGGDMIYRRSVGVNHAPSAT